ncbi:MAG: single-stranded-DNA-specific exonuclease RecJ, partial [Phycisphaerales bacterium]|nr:single-stranded-DNA-specific exonuclease RecJ [Phycisphaerales bacterium]
SRFAPNALFLRRLALNSAPVSRQCRESSQRSAAIRITTFVDRDWIIAPPHPERSRLAREADIAELLAQLLLNRGVRTAVEVREFLAPDMRGLLPPETLPNAPAAAERLVAALREKRRIVIYGDYDVDGVTATSILWHMLTLAGADVAAYIPSRMDEGYGLNGEALEKIAADGPATVITVDCGVTALKEARCARSLGLELIITDHHEMQAALPDVDVLVHPRLAGGSPNPDLSGAGVALKVAWAFAKLACGGERVGPQYREALLDAMAFAALGLVADVVPLTGENRIIASYGLRQLRHTGNPGLRALIEVSGLGNRETLDDYDVGFMLAPRLNAVGRLGHAQLAVELFTRADPDRAREIAATLDTQNRRRQEVERRIVRQAEDMVVERGFHLDGCRAIVLASREWHVGVIGIAAARLVDRFQRPTILIALDQEQGQGSGRSVRHFPLHEVLSACSAHLVSHGGHAMAAGVRVKCDMVDEFTTAFQAEAARRLTSNDLRPRLQLDDEVRLDQLTEDAVVPIQRMAPFGTGNHRPRLATTTVDLVDEPRVVGKSGTHLQFTVRQGSAYRKAIAFNRGDQARQLSEHRRLRLAFEPIVNEWNGTRRIELKVLDWKLGG